LQKLEAGASAKPEAALKRAAAESKKQTATKRASEPKKKIGNKIVVTRAKASSLQKAGKRK
jgi:hypothetical protein